MEGESMRHDNNKLPEIIVFAGPNGSGKSTITRMAKVIEPYINADDIKRTNYCSDLEAAQIAERMREEAISNNNSFTFETVLSTERNLNLLKKAKEQGYFIRGIYVLTSDVNINIMRVLSREALGGHGVPEDKIRSRYEKALRLIPQLVELCDVLHIYDNTSVPFRIFKKRKEKYFLWQNASWSRDRIIELVGVDQNEFHQ